MIRFRIVDGMEMFTNDKLRFYERRDFYWLLEGNILSDERFPPFRDAESLRLIQEIDHAELVENDWYSMITPYGRTCMSALCGSTRYGLVVIHNSKKGYYTRLGSAGANVWKVLADLPMDILIVTIREALFQFTFPSDVPCILENYPYQGKQIDLVVDPSRRMGKERFEEIDGKLYTNHFYWMFEHELRYDWKKDIASIVRYCDREVKEKGNRYLFPRKICQSLSELEQEIGEDFSYAVSWEKEPNQKLEKWYREHLTIWNHLMLRPGRVSARRMTYLMIREGKDAFYELSERISIGKWPSLEGFFYDAVYRNTSEELKTRMTMEHPDSQGSSGADDWLGGYLLAVDVDEVFRCISNLEKARWGIHWYWDDKGGITVEIYDSVECLKEFADRLRPVLRQEEAGE